MRIAISILLSSFFLALAGCGTPAGMPQKAGYQAQVSGEFDDTGQYSATMSILADYAAGTFEGVMSDFRFSRRGFNAPAGFVPISGTITRNDDGGLLFAGKGQGSLTQGRFEYLPTIEMESGFVPAGGDNVAFWFFGAGEFRRNGNFADWPGVTGEFEAPMICKEVPFSPPCPALRADVVAEAN